MTEKAPHSFKATIEIIGVNPYVFVPKKILAQLFKEAGKDKGKIPVRMSIDGHEFTQTLIKYSGYWRLYLNMPMRKAAGKDVGDKAQFEIKYDPIKRAVPMHPKLKKALKEHQDAKKIYDSLRPSLQLEIVRYISFLKTEESIDKNVTRAINFLLGKERFIGRDKPL
ncbi:MAG: YdeI/OmpD-associated family protein [Bacteroidota bacterium]